MAGPTKGMIRAIAFAPSDGNSGNPRGLSTERPPVTAANVTETPLTRGLERRRLGEFGGWLADNICLSGSNAHRRTARRSPQSSPIR